jgi:hypothetical protein
VIALGYGDNQPTHQFELFVEDYDYDDDSSEFSDQELDRTDWEKIIRNMNKYGKFYLTMIAWAALLFLTVLALGNAAKSHNSPSRKECICSNATSFCQNCFNATWFSVPRNQKFG